MMFTSTVVSILSQGRLACPKFCLEKNGDIFHLKQDHAYYYQVRVNFKVFNIYVATY